jgi:hypothetical protein
MAAAGLPLAACNASLEFRRRLSVSDSESINSFVAMIGKRITTPNVPGLKRFDSVNLASPHAQTHSYAYPDTTYN